MQATAAQQGGGVSGAQLDQASLPTPQFDRRNVTGTRWLELAASFKEPEIAWEGVDASPLRLTLPLSFLEEAFAYDRRSATRTLTFGLDFYSIQRAEEVPPSEREPIAISVPELEENSRFFCMLPNDQGQGLAGAVLVSRLGPLPATFTFVIGLLAPDATDSRIYNVNQPRLLTVPPTVQPPYWHSQRLRSLYVRFYVKANFEPNRIPVMSGPSGLTGGSGTPPTVGVGALGDESIVDGHPMDLSPEIVVNYMALARGYPDMIPHILRVVSNHLRSVPEVDRPRLTATQGLLQALAGVAASLGDAAFPGLTKKNAVKRLSNGQYLMTPFTGFMDRLQALQSHALVRGKTQHIPDLVAAASYGSSGRSLLDESGPRPRPRPIPGAGSGKVMGGRRGKSTGGGGGGGGGRGGGGGAGGGGGGGAEGGGGGTAGEDEAPDPGFEDVGPTAPPPTSAPAPRAPRRGAKRARPEAVAEGGGGAPADVDVDAEESGPNLDGAPPLPMLAIMPPPPPDGGAPAPDGGAPDGGGAGAGAAVDEDEEGTLSPSEGTLVLRDALEVMRGGQDRERVGAPTPEEEGEPGAAASPTMIGIQANSRTGPRTTAGAQAGGGRGGAADQRQAQGQTTGQTTATATRTRAAGGTADAAGGVAHGITGGLTVSPAPRVAEAVDVGRGARIADTVHPVGAEAVHVQPTIEGSTTTVTPEITGGAATASPHILTEGVQVTPNIMSEGVRVTPQIAPHIATTAGTTTTTGGTVHINPVINPVITASGAGSGGDLAELHRRLTDHENAVRVLASQTGELRGYRDAVQHQQALGGPPGRFGDGGGGGGGGAGGGGAGGGGAAGASAIAERPATVGEMRTIMAEQTREVHEARDQILRRVGDPAAARASAGSGVGVLESQLAQFAQSATSAERELARERAATMQSQLETLSDQMRTVAAVVHSLDARARDRAALSTAGSLQARQGTAPQKRGRGGASTPAPLTLDSLTSLARVEGITRAVAVGESLADMARPHGASSSSLAMVPSSLTPAMRNTAASIALHGAAARPISLPGTVPPDPSLDGIRTELADEEAPEEEEEVVAPRPPAPTASTIAATPTAPSVPASRASSFIPPPATVSSSEPPAARPLMHDLRPWSRSYQPGFPRAHDRRTARVQPPTTVDASVRSAGSVEPPSDVPPPAAQGVAASIPHTTVPGARQVDQAMIADGAARTVAEAAAAAPPSDRTAAVLPPGRELFAIAVPPEKVTREGETFLDARALADAHARGHGPQTALGMALRRPGDVTRGASTHLTLSPDETAAMARAAQAAGHRTGAPATVPGGPAGAGAGVPTAVPEVEEEEEEEERDPRRRAAGGAGGSS